MKYFGTDGVRGKANRFPVNAEMAIALTRAAAKVLGWNGIPVPVGWDTRRSSTMLAGAVASGLASAGVDSKLIGVIPTGGISYLTRSSGASFGVMISASHNPFEDNGIKFFSSSGCKLEDEEEKEIEDVLESFNCDSLPEGEKVGVITGLFAPPADVEHYEKYLLSLVDSLEGLDVVLDTANGAASAVAPEVFRKLGADVETLAASPNGLNINDDCGSTSTGRLAAYMKERGRGTAFAYDGDADRVLVVSKNGVVVDGDHLMIALATDLKERGKLPGNRVVVTVMSNMGFMKAARERGITVEVTPVGDRQVLRRMVETGSVLGGEQSGHIILSEYASTGDGLVTSLMLAGLMKRKNIDGSELEKVMETFPQVLVNVRVRSKNGWDEIPEIRAAIEKVERELGNDGRVLVRPSGTEPLIRVMAEGPDRERLRELVESTARVIEHHLGG